MPLTTIKLEAIAQRVLDYYGLSGDETLLDTEDHTDEHWWEDTDQSDTINAREFANIQIECVGEEDAISSFTDYADITDLVDDGLIVIMDNIAYIPMHSRLKKSELPTLTKNPAAPAQ